MLEQAASKASKASKSPKASIAAACGPCRRERFGRKLAEYASSPAATTPGGGRAQRARHGFSERKSFSARNAAQDEAEGRDAEKLPEAAQPLFNGPSSDAVGDAAC